MKRTAIFLALLLALGTARAQQATDAQAAQAAIGFFNAQRGTALGPNALKPMPLPDMPHLRAFAVGDSAFVVVSTDLRVDPILGYSFENPFPTPLHPELRYWLGWYDEQLAAMPPATKSASTHFRWGALGAMPTDEGDPSDDDPSDPTPDPHRTEIHYMLQTVWDQSPYYNNLCPFDDTYGTLTVVGCTATAMAQLMKYWNHPSCGVGSHSYEHPDYGELSADFGNTTYIWSKMPSNISQGTPDDQVQATAVLSLHCGIACDMSYGTAYTGGSGAHVISYGNPNLACSENAFRNYFKYSPDLHGEMRHNFSDSLWVSMINDDLENGRPILYTGYDTSAGHAFVLDGRDTMGFYHFNWGWSGMGNGMYKIDSLNVGTGGVGANASLSFNMGQQAVFGVEPVPEEFDTVTYYDTFCAGMGRVQFFEYDFPAREATYRVIHLNTVYDLHLVKTDRRQAYIVANGGQGESFTHYFCPPDGLVMPDNPFVRNGHTFLGWSLSYNGATGLFQPGDTIRRTTNCTLYAIWQRDEALGIASSATAAVSISPNPATTLLRVGGAPAGATYRLADALGRIVMQGNLGAEGAEINIQQLTAGLYFLTVEASGSLSTHRIIKQ